MVKGKFNLYRDVGCSQEDHLPNCGHFGYSGMYLGSHLSTCPQDKGNTKPCNCNPIVRGVKGARLFNCR